MGKIEYNSEHFEKMKKKVVSTGHSRPRLLGPSACMNIRRDAIHSPHSIKMYKMSQEMSDIFGLVAGFFFPFVTGPGM